MSVVERKIIPSTRRTQMGISDTPADAEGMDTLINKCNQKVLWQIGNIT